MPRIIIALALTLMTSPAIAQAPTQVEFLSFLMETTRWIVHCDGRSRVEVKNPDMLMSVMLDETNDLLTISPGTALFEDPTFSPTLEGEQDPLNPLRVDPMSLRGIPMTGFPMFYLEREDQQRTEVMATVGIPFTSPAIAIFGRIKDGNRMTMTTTAILPAPDATDCLVHQKMKSVLSSRGITFVVLPDVDIDVGDENNVPNDAGGASDAPMFP